MVQPPGYLGKDGPVSGHTRWETTRHKSARARRLRTLIDPGQLARAYDMPCWDYERPGTGLGVVNGAGGLLALMDSRTDLRWCVSVEGLRDGGWPQAASFFMAVAALRIPVAVYVVCMGLTDPAAVANALLCLAGKFDYHANCVLPGRECSLDDLFRGVPAWEAGMGDAAPGP
jgi:hypothetical protein